MTSTGFGEFGYEEVKVIGRGQYGKAHLVRSTTDPTAYCIAKTIDLTCLSSKEREAALQEVHLLRRLDHPNIVSYYQNFYIGETLVIIMQYCEGGDLSSYIKDCASWKKRIPEVLVMAYFVQMLLALQYIHQERILHRDLKSSNLFLTLKKTVLKLGDFGISRVLEGSVEAAITVVGTPYYMSPEVCENKPYTYKSDVWSLGCVLYELCMLKHAFSADNLLGLVYKIVSDNYEPIPKMYTQQLNGLIQRMLEKDAEKRPSVKDLMADTHVKEAMNQYASTRGKCATPSASTLGRGRTAGSGGTPSGGAGMLPAAAVERAKGSKDRPTLCPAPGSAGGGGGGAVPSRPSRRPKCAGTAVRETPKEAAARRKREAADRKAEELKAATKQSLTNKGVARRLKEAEFQSTRQRDQGHATATLGPALSAPEGMAGSSSEPLEPQTVMEEISESEGEDDETCSSAEEYEDDFEEEYVSEGEAEEIMEEEEEGSEIEEFELGGVEAGGAVVREEQDVTRVVSNCERVLAGASPPQRRTPDRFPAVGSGSGGLGAPSPGGHGQVALPSAPSGPPPGSAVMDMRSRAGRLKEELVRKMGADMFQRAFDCLYKARERSADEKAVRRELECLMGKDAYKLYGFDIDQLVFQSRNYG